MKIFEQRFRVFISHLIKLYVNLFSMFKPIYFLRSNVCMNLINLLINHSTILISLMSVGYLKD